MQEPIQLDNIGGGDLVEAANLALQKIVEDVKERSFVDAKREVLIKIRIAPKLEINGMNIPEIEFEVAAKKPAHKGATERGHFLEDGNLHVNANDPTCSIPGQTNIIDAVEEAEEEGKRRKKPKSMQAV